MTFKQGQPVRIRSAEGHSGALRWNTLLGVLLWIAMALPAAAQNSAPEVSTPEAVAQEERVQLDFEDVELAVLIDTIARLTGKNFIYDDRVRGRVTIVSPTSVTIDQAYAVFESVLRVKGFTAVPGPGGVMKVIPVRDAKESNLETIMDQRESPNRDLFVTRLIPLSYIDAESITNTVKGLVSKDASMVAYAPTNTIIITDTSANIQRLMNILDAIDIETHKEELAVIKIRHADATTLAEQVGEIYDSTVVSGTNSRPRPTRRGAAPKPAATTGTSGGRAPIRIITDARTNSLLVLASRAQLVDIRSLVQQLDVPVVGGGRIHVYYLKHSDAEELAQTMNSLLTGQSAGGAGRTGAAGAGAQPLRSAVTQLAEDINVTADPATNSLVIQASKEAYETVIEVIEMLDIARPQVLVEALIMEVDVTDSIDLGFDGAMRYINGSLDLYVNTAKGALTAGVASFPLPNLGGDSGVRLADTDGTYYSAIITAAARDANINILSAPHILTSDNEEAEIQIGDNIPIVTSRVDNATGNVAGLSSSVNVERKDIGVTLRVTPQISEGDALRLKIYQQISQVNEALTEETGAATEVGVALSNRQVENTVVVNDGETVVIGGLISERFVDEVNKVPWLGDIPFLGWLFKTIQKKNQKINLLIFLTPHIIRSAEDLEYETVRKREEFETSSGEYIDPVEAQRGTPNEKDSPVRNRLLIHSKRYPQDRMREIEGARNEDSAKIEAARLAPVTQYGIRAGVFSDERTAAATLTRLIDSGYDGTLSSSQTGGVLLFEIQIGPYNDLEGAEQTFEILRDAYSLDPAITILETEGP